MAMRKNTPCLKNLSRKLIEQFKLSETPRYLIADSFLPTEANAGKAKDLRFITRIPNNVKLVGETIDKALSCPAEKQTLDDGRMMQTFNVEHYDIKQRWHVQAEETSRQQAAKQVDKRVTLVTKTIEKQLGQKQVKRFCSVDDAIAAARSLAKKWKLHYLNECKTVEHKEYEGKGRPKKGQKPSQIKYQALVVCAKDEEKISQAFVTEGHYIIGGNTEPFEISDKEVVDAYKKQYHVERGFRFLKDPLFFASSLFVKNNKRLMSLLMVMLLSLLVYGIAERRMRAALKEQEH